MFATQFLGRGEAGGAPSNYHDLPGRFRVGARWRLRTLALPDDENLALAHLHPPARERPERRRAHSFAGTQVEACMMPGAADCRVDHKALGERTTVVCATGVNREYLVAATHQQHLRVTAMADHFPTVGEVGKGHPQDEIRPYQFAFVLIH
jgi:hypothetical protein